MFDPRMRADSFRLFVSMDMVLHHALISLKIEVGHSVKHKYSKTFYRLDRT